MTTVSSMSEPHARHAVAPKPTSKRRRVVLLVVELAAMIVSLSAIIGSVGLLEGASAIAQLAVGSLIGVAFITIVLSVGLYSREIVYNLVRSTQRFIGAGVIFSLMLYITLSVLAPATLMGHRHGVLLLTAAAGASASLVLIMRVLLVHALSVSWLRRRLLVVGHGTKAMKLHRIVTERLMHEATIVSIVRFQDEPEGSNWTHGSTGPVDGQLLEVCASLAVDEIVVARDNQRGMPTGELLACRTAGIRIRDYISFLEEETGYIDVDELRPSALIFSWGFDRSPVFLTTKRLFDIVVSVFLLVFTLPLTIATVVAIRLDSPGPILFRQDRVGLNGRRFRVLKFRSMRIDAEREGPQWAALKDARVTRIGRILRKTRIDEIPQLVNVLKGDMSFVGPRPERPFFVDSLRAVIPFYDERHKMKPGLTGWAQINYPYGASVEDAKEKLAYDLYYAKSASMVLDVLIALQTMKVILFSSGAR